MRIIIVINAIKMTVVLAIFAILLTPVQTRSQVRPVNDNGALGLGRLLKKLNTTASVMMIGAHPDDEDSALIAYLARGENARTAYLSLTRGDGGQNIIGPELFESLGVIRTEELLQARRLDGAEQYFARAFDYGFSKTLDEAKSKWPQEVIMCDVVRAIRSFRPLVVISRFTGTPADGHGQHQYAGFISPLAVSAAADRGQCIGAGDPWQVAKFYVEQGASANATGGLRINTGRFDPILGRSYFEIAIEGRSQHRSQGEGRIELKGDQFSMLNLKNVEPIPAETSPFDRLDTSIFGIARLTNNSEEPFEKKLVALQKQIADVRAKYRVESPGDIAADLAAIYKAAFDAQWSTRKPRSKDMMRDVQKKAVEAFRISAGIQVDVLSDKEAVSPGDSLDVTARAFVGNLSKDAIAVKETNLNVPLGWSVNAKPEPTPTTTGGPFRRESGVFNGYYNVVVSKDAKITEPYWLRTERTGETYDWPSTDDQTLPFSPPDVVATVTFSIGGVDVPVSQPLQFRYADTARGELRREINVVPKVAVKIAPSLLVISKTDKAVTKQITLRVTDNSTKPETGSIDLKLPQGWSVKQQFGVVRIGNKGKDTSFVYDVTIPPNTKPGKYVVGASVRFGEEIFSDSMNAVAYPHVQTHRYYTPATTSVDVIDLKTAGGKIGYIMGSGDEAPEAIRQMGFDVTMLEEKDLSSGDLSRFDSIVVGIRASETRPDLVANNARLLDYVRGGGNVVVQYQRFAWTGLAPYPVDINDKQRTAAGSIARVVDENAAVTILEPSNPVFSTPNRITDDDFKGWVQERNAYNLVTFDPQYTPLLESHDAGEQENKGGLVIAKVGKGNWVYCSYSFFRQLPAGVPGAYRLFANLLSMPRVK